MFMLLPCLYIAPTKKMGRGVFTSRALKAHTVIEVSPVIVMSGKERGLLDQTLLHDYIFEWGDDGSRCCVALGYVSVYNHSFQSNCEYEMEFDTGQIRVFTVKPVQKDEELFINYNGSSNNTKPLWFDAQ